jgi:fructose-1,6-bisphosphatase/sedoheptulose 1,7-bisphosphatase-like protein
MIMQDDIFKDTAAIETLWGVFNKMKRVEYGSVVEIGDGFKADSEMLYNCFQKELNAQSKISMN